MAGYVRQSAAQILTGATIQASHFNNEYNALAAAFDGATGHTHDGTTGNSPPLSITAATTGTLPVSRGGTGATTLTGILKGNGTGAFTATAVLPVADGGTGASTLTGYIKGNGTSPFTASATIPSTDISGGFQRFQVGGVDTNTTPRLKLNFLNGVTAVDNPGNDTIDVTVLPVGGGVVSTTQVATTDSLQGGGNLTTSRTLSLVGDTTTPGNNKLYGTNGAGARGWYDRTLPTTTITGINSISGGGNLTSNRTFQLVNDSAAPGNDKVYGTNESGVLGWQDSAETPGFILMRAGIY